MSVARTMSVRRRTPRRPRAPTALAREVERLGSGWRHTLEQALDAKATISAEPRRVARELGG